MSLALRTGQPYEHILAWHPRDVDTAWQILIDQDSERLEQERDARFAAMGAELARRMAGG